MRSLTLSPCSVTQSASIDSTICSRRRSAAPEPSYPPYNIVEQSGTPTGSRFAVAGFGDDELDLVVQENLLTVLKANDAEAEKNVAYLREALPGARSSIASSWPTTSRSPARRSWSAACSTSSWCARCPRR